MRIETPISRRGFIHGCAGLGAMAAVQRTVSAYAQNHASHATPAPGGVTNEIELIVREEMLHIGDRIGSSITINNTLPGPVVRLREGSETILRVTNHLADDTSIHWHGLLLPPAMDGVPGVSFSGIKPGETFTYSFPVRQNGTYWYHSHSGLQEQAGHYGPLIIDSAEPEPFAYDREYCIVLSDWTPEMPMRIVSKLKSRPNYYNFQRRTVGTFLRDASKGGWKSTMKERLEWAKMRMDPTDISDITGYTYTFLMNGLAPEANWTGLIQQGERVRLRFINAGAATYFDVRIPGLPMTVVSVDGQHVQPVTLAVCRTFTFKFSPHASAGYSTKAFRFS